MCLQDPRENGSPLYGYSCKKKNFDSDWDLSKNDNCEIYTFTEQLERLLIKKYHDYEKEIKCGNIWLCYEKLKKKCGRYSKKDIYGRRS